MLPRKGIATLGGPERQLPPAPLLQEMLPRKGIATLSVSWSFCSLSTVARDASPKGDCDRYPGLPQLRLLPPSCKRCFPERGLRRWLPGETPLEFWLLVARDASPKGDCDSFPSARLQGHAVIPVARDASPKGDCDTPSGGHGPTMGQELQEMLPRKGIATQATSLGILFL